jgi:hypothetical protein
VYKYHIYLIHSSVEGNFGERMQECEYGTNIVCKWKTETSGNYCRNGGEQRVKEKDGGGKFKYDIFETL